MAGEAAFHVEGRIVEVMSNGTYRVELANGHRLLGFVAGKSRWTHGRFALGQSVRLRLSPCDLATGRILVGN